MSYGNFKDFPRRTASDMMDITEVLFIFFFDKISSHGAVKSEK